MLRFRLLSEDWTAGDPLPSETALANELAVSPGTLRKALAALSEDGLIERRQGAGTFATGCSPASQPAISVAGMDGTPLELECSRQAAGQTEDQRWFLERLWTTSGRPGLVERSEISTVAMPDALPFAIDPRVVLAALSDVVIEDLRQTVHMVSAPHGAAWALGVEVGVPLLQINQRAYDGNGAVIEERRGYLAPDLLLGG